MIILGESSAGSSPCPRFDGVCFLERLLRVLSSAKCLREFLLVRVGQDRRFNGDRQLADFAGEDERHLVVLVIDRRTSVRADVER